jgi:threonine dehydrogenase-like Zn-dependent dehydrogenase
VHSTVIAFGSCGCSILRLAECCDELVGVSQPALVPEEQQSFPLLLRYTSFESYEAARILATHGVDSLTSQPTFSFAQGPIGLCATAGAKLMGASLIIGVEADENRRTMSRRMGADVTLDYREVDVDAEVKKLTGGGADVSIEALGTQQTFESALRCLRPGGTLSSLGVYSGKLQMPYEAFAAGLGDHRIVTTLCPGGKERMRRLMEVVRAGRVDLSPLLTHTVPLDQIVQGYKIFGERLDGVLKVAVKP